MSEAKPTLSETTKTQEARLTKRLLEAYATDPERLAARREELEALPLFYLDGQRNLAVEQLHKKLKQDPQATQMPRAAHVRDGWQLALLSLGDTVPITVSSNETSFGANGLVKIYTEDVNAPMDDPEGANKKDEVSPSIVVSTVGAANSRGADAMTIAQSSIRDMQDRVNSILLLEVLAERIANPGGATSSEVGRVAIHNSLQ